MASEPTFSIVIPTFLRPQQLSACLASMTRLEYPSGKFEVIVVSDGDSNLPVRLIEQIRKRIPLTIYFQEKAGPAAARNTGAEHATGEYLAFTDDDCSPDAQWLRCLASRFVSVPECMIGGMTTNGLKRNVFSTASQMILLYLYADSMHRLGPNHFFASNNIAVKRALFKKTGGFDARFQLSASEDRDFCRRWRQRGYRMIYAPEAVVFHFHNLNFMSFLRQHFNYGRGAFLFYRNHVNFGIRRFPVQLPSFYFNLIRYPLSSPKAKKRPLLITLLAISQAATFIGYLHEQYRFTMQGTGSRWQENR